MKKVLSLILSLVLLGGLVGCGDNAQTSGKTDTLRIGFFPNITHAQALVGKSNGEFEKAFEGQNVEWTPFNAGPDEIESFLASQLDIGFIGPGPAINGHTVSNGEIQIIAGATDAGAILVARKGLNLKSVKDLKDKKVAIPQYGNTQDITLRGLLKENGLKDTARGGTVEIVQAKNPDIKVLLDDGQIDAALVPEPWGSILIKEAGAEMVLDANETWRNGEYTIGLVIARKEFVENNPELVEKFLKTHIELTDYINENPEEAKDIINKELKELTDKSLPDDVLTEGFKRVKVTYNLEKEAIHETGDLSFEAGYLKEEPELSNLFNLDLLEKVIKEN